ncbi:MAG TPA: glycine-rich protein [Candidatus Baltobacteraceae bacterium]|nr:glycine-rich protein [Candidatus Baltobacteraceae bacterium]
MVGLLAGCAGNAGQAVSPSLGGQAVSSGASSATTFSEPDAKTSGTLTITLTVPKKQPKHEVRGGYVSPSTQGMALVLAGPSSGTQAFDLTAHNPKCKKSKSGLTCKISVALKVGTYTADVDLYDQAPVNGQIPYTAHLLSSATKVPFSIMKGKSTAITPTLQGVAASLSIANLPQPCTAIPATPFTVSASDAHTYTIVGGYAVPITLSNSDTSGATTIATKGKDNPPADTLLSSSDVATIAWNGSPIPGGAATIGAQAGSPKVYASAQFTAGISPGGTLLSYTGAPQNFVVPTCATTVYIEAIGAQGAAAGAASGGYGGLVGATIPTTPGESLTVNVGGMGVGGYSTAGGYNGGAPGSCQPSLCDDWGGGGGGASDARQGGTSLSKRVIVAGGGGGAGGIVGSFPGGTGGGLTGGAGGPQSYTICGISSDLDIVIAGGGGTQTSGGVGGVDQGSHENDGAFGEGGPGVGSCSDRLFHVTGAGGGGGGWYGGGGGYSAGGGGGGSGFAENSATNVSMVNGEGAGAGFVVVCWGYSNKQCSSADRKKLKLAQRLRSVSPVR